MSNNQPEVFVITCGCGHDVGFLDSNEKVRCAYCGSTAQARVVN